MRDVTNGPGFVLSGYRSDSRTNYQGSDGYYWSSTAYDTRYAYLLYLGSSNVYPALNLNKYYGFSVRCVAK